MTVYFSCNENQPARVTVETQLCQSVIGTTGLNHVTVNRRPISQIYFRQPRISKVDLGDGQAGTEIQKTRKLLYLWQNQEN